MPGLQEPCFPSLSAVWRGALGALGAGGEAPGRWRCRRRRFATRGSRGRAFYSANFSPRSPSRPAVARGGSRSLTAPSWPGGSAGLRVSKGRRARSALFTWPRRWTWSRAGAAAAPARRGQRSGAAAAPAERLDMGEERAGSGRLRGPAHRAPFPAGKGGRVGAEPSPRAGTGSGGRRWGPRLGPARLRSGPARRPRWSCLAMANGPSRGRRVCSVTSSGSCAPDTWEN